MQVYCLLGSIDYEGSTLLGVYASAEAAEAARAQVAEYDSYTVEVRELGGFPGADYEVGCPVLEV
jgi:hypothetical protein